MTTSNNNLGSCYQKWGNHFTLFRLHK